MELTYIVMHLILSPPCQFEICLIYVTGIGHKERVDNVGKFKEWMQENGVHLEKLQLEDYGVELGIGLKAVADIQVICM